MLRVLHGALVLLGLFLCGYGLHCAMHMHDYIGSGHYWSNPWFYKAHAALFGVVANSIAISFVRDWSKRGKS